MQDIFDVARDWKWQVSEIVEHILVVGTFNNSTTIHSVAVETSAV